ncbi:hypothetical protein JCM3765_007375 [Sporobolomyces pararoseus]
MSDYKERFPYPPDNKEYDNFTNLNDELLLANYVATGFGVLQGYQSSEVSAIRSTVNSPWILHYLHSKHNHPSIKRARPSRGRIVELTRDLNDFWEEGRTRRRKASKKEDVESDSDESEAEYTVSAEEEDPEVYLGRSEDEAYGPDEATDTETEGEGEGEGEDEKEESETDSNVAEDNKAQGSQQSQSGRREQRQVRQTPKVTEKLKSPSKKPTFGSRRQGKRHSGTETGSPLMEPHNGAAGPPERFIPRQDDSCELYHVKREHDGAGGEDDALERQPKRRKKRTPDLILSDDDEDVKPKIDDSSLKDFLHKLSPSFDLAQHAHLFRSAKIGINTSSQLMEVAGTSLEGLLAEVSRELAFGPTEALRRGLQKELEK